MENGIDCLVKLGCGGRVNLRMKHIYIAYVNMIMRPNTLDYGIHVLERQSLLYAYTRFKKGPYTGTLRQRPASTLECPSAKGQADACSR